MRGRWHVCYGSGLSIIYTCTCIIPTQDLQRLIEQQKAACDAMTDEKDKLVNEFQQVRKTYTHVYTHTLSCTTVFIHPA